MSSGVPSKGVIETGRDNPSLAKEVKRRRHKGPISWATGTKPVRSAAVKTMFVVKRDGKTERLSFDKITSRISKLCFNLSPQVDSVIVSQKVIAGLASGVTTTEIDQQAARNAAQMVTHHPHYSNLAARLAVSDLQRRTKKRFSELVEKLHGYVHPKTGRHMPLVSDEVLEIARKHKDQLDAAIIHNRDMNFSYFGLRTLMRSYLLRMNNEVVESPQHMYMRVAIGIHGHDIDAVVATYHLLSKGVLSHASPTMFNSGTTSPQMASCFLLQPPGADPDSIDGIYKLLHQCALISKTAGGIGFSASGFRAEGSYIAGTNGTSNGLVPMLRVFNSTAKYVDQGGNKRPGAFACYLEPWHADVFSWLELKLQGGKEELRARDLFFALWVPDLFMRRVEQDAEWTLMCPHECPGLDQVWGQEFEDLYTRYERENRGQRVVKAQELWFAILRVQLETGTPYMLYKDTVNAKSNQQNLGTIKQSNLCVAGDTEVLTEEGPMRIQQLATAHLDSAETKAAAAEVVATEAKIAELEAEKAAAEGARAEEIASALVAFRAKLAALDRVELSSRDPTPVKVWNGKRWSEVVPVQTGAGVPLMRVTTSHGSVIDCTLQHKFILADGSRREAQQLAVGAALAPSPPVKYPGSAKYDLPPDEAFLRGYVYAYAVLKKGTQPACLGPKAPSLKVPILVIVKATVTQDTLARLGYDEAASRAQIAGQDHDALAFVPVPEASQAIQSRLVATEEVRRAWVSGFLTACGGKLDEVRASHSLLSRVRTMFRSVGEDARLSPAGRDGLWQLHWPEDPAAPPTVIAVQHMGAVEDTFCFTEPDEHAGVFNEQLAGQCSEIVEYTDDKEIAVCNLASIALPRFVRPDTGDEAESSASRIDFAELHAVVKSTVINMNRIIDRNLYVLEGMKTSNLRHRPIGIGVQGLADVYAMLRLPWEDEWGVANAEAKRLNIQIFETMYHAALEASCELAQADGTYETYAGSPVSKGVLQYDMWKVTPTELWDWAALKAKIAEHGIRNSQLLTCMPTASTAGILGNNESIEPYTSNIYTRSVLSGEFQIVNKYLVYELIEEGLWDESMRQEIIAHSGSVQAIDRIPKKIKDVFKTVWEISQKTLIDFSADRGAFICQSQSFNLHMDPTSEMLSSAHFYGWEQGLKTGMYYLRSKPAADAIKFTISPEIVEQAKAARVKAKSSETRTQDEIDEDNERLACSRANPGACTMCSA